MTKSFPHISLWGDNFSPKKLCNISGIQLKSQNEVGELGTIGKYKGIPYDYGSGIIEAPEHLKSSEKEEWLIEKALLNMQDFKNTGVTDFVFHITYAHDGQCNLQFTSEFIQKLAMCKMDLTISCYQDENEF